MAEVDQIIAEARDFASSSYDAAEGLVSSAVTIANSIASPNLPTFSTFRSTPDVVDPGAPPDNVPVPDQLPAVPDAPSFEAVYTPTVPDFGQIAVPEPLDTDTLFQQPAPEFDLPGAPSGAPTIGEHSFPEAPELHFPEQPDTLELTFPDDPSVRVPSFDPSTPREAPGKAPDAEAKITATYRSVLPEMRAFLDEHMDSFVQRYAPEQHEAMAKLERRLSEMMDGGTAMPDDVEQKLYDQTRRRTEAQRREREDEAWEAAARRGFTLPPGILNAAVQRAGQEAASANTTAASEVAVEMARLEQQNIQFALQTSSALRQAVLNAGLQYAGTLAQINGQAIQYAREIGSAAIEAYNAALAVFNAEVQYFQAQAQVYEVELRAAFAELEKYQALVRVEELKSSINTQKVQQYQAQIDAINSRINAYQTEVQAVAQRIDADRARVEAFGQEVQTYVARVRAKESETRAYVAALEGDRTKVDGYVAQVRAYNAQIEGMAAQAQAESAVSNAINQANQSLANVFNTEVQAFGAHAQALSSQHAAEVRAYAARIQAYESEVNARRTEFQSGLEASRLEFEQAQTEYRTQAEVGIQSARLYLQRAQNASQAATAGANTFASIASAAVSAQNTMVSLSREILEE